VSELVVKVSNELVEGLLAVPDELIAAEFMNRLVASSAKALRGRLNKRRVEPKSRVEITAEVAIEITELHALDQLKTEVGDDFDRFLSLILEDVIISLTSAPQETYIEEESSELLDIEIEDEFDEDISPPIELTPCCEVEVFDDGLGNLLCPECGGFVFNKSFTSVGCPSCGGVEFNSGGICQSCYAYVGPSISDWKPNPEGGWDPLDL